MNGSSRFDPLDSHKLSTSAELRAAIETLPLSEDRSDPALIEAVHALSQDEQLRAAYQRIGDLDHRIAAVIRDVPLPDGLASRVAAAVASASAPAPVASVTSAPSPLVLSDQSRSIRSRRWWLVAGSCAIVASIALLVMALTHWNADPTWNAAQLAEAAAQYSLSDDNADTKWRTDSPPNEYPFGRGVVSPAAIRWRLISDFLGQTAVAYSLPSIGGHRATLYVAHVNLNNTIDTPPRQPDFSTGRCAVAVWQRGSVTYLLVVVGDQPVSAYPWFLERPTSPLT